MSDSDVYEITCPKCAKTYQLRRVDRKARTCPNCGHVGARVDFPERKLEVGSGGQGSAPAPTNGAAAAAVPAANAASDAHKKRDREKRPLSGAAKANAEAKARGEPLPFGRVFNGEQARKAALKARGHEAAPPAAAAASSHAPSWGERIRRIL